jgi:anti-sigma regulatory factor (Ser/Thr protein kinase)
MGTMATMERLFPPEPDSSRASRRFVHDALETWGCRELNDVAQLLTTELVTNVVMHARTDVAVLIIWEHDVLRVEIRDGSSIIPTIRDLPSTEGGYGLRIIDAMSDTWGVETTSHGKAVWFQLRPSA